MNSLRSLSQRWGVTMFGAAIFAIVLVLVAGLYIADSGIRARMARESHLDAVQSASLVASSIDREREMLRGVGYSASRAQTSPGELVAFARDLFARSPSLDSLDVWDASGRAVLHAFRDARGVSVDANDAVKAGTLVSPTGESIGATRSSGGVLRLTTVVELESARVATVRATYTLSRLLAPLVGEREPDDATLLVLHGGDTLAVRGAPHTVATRSVAPIPVFGDSTWRVEVARQGTGLALRIALWVIGLIAIGLLTAGAMRERRDRIRIASRSAELERLSSELLRSNRSKSEFLANVSHELRTPLNAIVGFVELLREGVYGELSPRQSGPVDRIAVSAAHLRQLVDQVLDIAKVAAGRMEVHPEPIPLRSFVLNLVTDLEPLVNEKGLTLSIAVGSSLPRVRTDPAHLRQILVNLIGNAVKYTPSGGIAVRARLVGDAKTLASFGREAPDDRTLLDAAPDRTGLWVALQVVDTGIGIAPADQQRVFEEFEQVDAGSRSHSAERGTGLGLPIARRLAQLLGGDLTLESEVGRGSTFTVWLPVHPADAEARLNQTARTSDPAVAVSGGRST